MRPQLNFASSRIIDKTDALLRANGRSEDTQDAMNNSRSGLIYKAKYYDASPTWFAWNKLSVSDIFRLRSEPGFEGQKVWFWLNHPIRFVRLVGFICQIDKVAAGKYILLTLDDSSGANIELKIERISGTSLLPNGMKEYLPATFIDNVSIKEDMGLPVVQLDSKVLELGTIVKAEGEIEAYMQSRQMILHRLSRVANTNEEAAHWSKIAHWKRAILNEPWVLSVAEQDKMDRKAAEMGREEHARQKHRKRKMAKRCEDRAVRDEMQEKKRQTLEQHYNEGALPGSEILRMPWDD